MFPPPSPNRNKRDMRPATRCPDGSETARRKGIVAGSRVKTSSKPGTLFAAYYAQGRVSYPPSRGEACVGSMEGRERAARVPRGNLTGSTAGLTDVYRLSGQEALNIVS